MATQATPQPGGYKPQKYHRLAEIMTKDRNFAIFRRFDELNMLHLMSLQAEILELRGLFRARCQTDDEQSLRDGDEDIMFSGNFSALRASGTEMMPLQGSNESIRTEETQRTANTPNPFSQLGLSRQLQKKLSKYNTLLLQVTELSRVPAPRKSQLEELQGFLRDKKGGNNFLKGLEFWTWKEDNSSAFYSMNPPLQEDDALTQFITYKIASFFHCCLGRNLKLGKIVDEEAGLTSYSDSRLNKASNVIAIITSSTLPVITIFVLNALDSTTKRLGFTVLFTAIFAILLGLFSTAKRAEIFAATATFAAVEVVFIGSAINSK